MSKRPRRNRKSPALRAAFQETNVTPANFVLPLFIHEGWMQSIAYLSSKYSSKINLFEISCIDDDDLQEKTMLPLEPCQGALGLVGGTGFLTRY
jgi:hypothetical protein